jgi:hypothetical protein
MAVLSFLICDHAVPRIIARLIRWVSSLAMASGRKRTLSYASKLISWSGNVRKVVLDDLNPLHPDELVGNLSKIERDINRAMKCPAGKNQVYIRYLLRPQGTTRPRIALKCPHKAAIGEDSVVFYEHIKDFCTTHKQSDCPAWQNFLKSKDRAD